MKIRNICFAVVAILLAGCNAKVETTYHSNGKVLSEIQTKSGKREGLARYFYQNGRIEQEVSYSNNLPDGLLRRWNPKGTLILEEHYEAGLKTGIATTWNNKGKRLSEITWQADTMHGAAKEWYEHGVLKLEGNYYKGFYDGKWYWFSPEGKVTGEGFFKRGQGIVKVYHLNGKRASVTHYTANKKDGRETAWDLAGKLVLDREWENGKIKQILAEEKTTGYENH